MQFSICFTQSERMVTNPFKHYKMASAHGNLNRSAIIRCYGVDVLV